MIVKQVYETKDGKHFDDKAAAKAHEAELEVLEQLGTLLDTSLKTGRPASVLKQMLMEAPEVINILRAYTRSLPKEPAAIRPAAATMKTTPVVAAA